MLTVQVDLHENQAKLFANRSKRNTWRCGRRFGKTTAAIVLILEVVKDGGQVIYTTPTYTDLEERFVEFENKLQRLIRPSKDFILNFKSGGRCLMYGLHRYDNIRGGANHRAINDEFAHSMYGEDAWNLGIRPTLTDFEGDAYFISTPKGRNHFSVMCERPDYTHHHFTSYDNPFLSHAEIEDARKEMPSSMFRQEYLAEFVDLSGARLNREWLRYGEVPDGADYSVGVDLAISDKTEADYTALVVTAKHGDNYYVVDVVRRKMTFHETKNAIENISRKYNPVSVGIESVQYQAAMIQELIRTTTLPIQAIKPHRDKVTRFQVVEGKYEHGFIFHSRNLPQDFETELLSFPIAEHDDMVDALVYSINGHDAGFKFGWI